jgi:CheY-like chemotaxis protein
VNEGSTFYFTIPFLDTAQEKPSSREDIEQKIPEKKKQIDYDWRGKTILIVEDEYTNIQYLQEIFKRTGASVLEALSGAEALKIIAENSSVSLVIMDIMMPEMDGYEATKQIRKIRPQLAIIAQTAYTKSREKEKSLEAGCDGYISKPYDPPTLLRLIHNFI